MTSSRSEPRGSVVRRVIHKRPSLSRACVWRVSSQGPRFINLSLHHTPETEQGEDGGEPGQAPTGGGGDTTTGVRTERAGLWVDIARLRGDRRPVWGVRMCVREGDCKCGDDVAGTSLKRLI